MSQIVDAPAQSLGALVVSELRLMYGSKFAQQWESLTPRKLRDFWDQKLVGLTEPEVRQALVACLTTREWPPTLPEFLRLCRPWLDPEIAFQAAVAGMTARGKGNVGAWPHPAIYWAAVELRADLLSQGWQALRGRWEAAYRAQLARASWEPIPAPTEALPAPGGTVTTPEEGVQQAQDLADRMAKGPCGDQRAWAKAILDEQARKGGRRYSQAVLDMARRALGIDTEVAK
ncbi:MAG: hypothetical protein J0I30_00720 [Burkholderiales bacterium]|nr:hypothetical protein [Burkholderiales bacterium]